MKPFRSHIVRKLVLVVATGIIACRNIEEDMRPDMRLHQELTLTYYKHNNKIVASALFRENNEKGKAVQLSALQTLLFNDRHYTRTVGGVNDEYTYVWESDLKAINNQVIVELKSTSGKILKNTLNLADTFNIDISKEWNVADKNSDLIVEWLGAPIRQDDQIMVKLRQGTRVTEDYVADNEGERFVKIPLKAIADFEKGSAEIILKRTRIQKGLMYSDGEAGGVRKYQVETRRIINLR